MGNTLARGGAPKILGEIIFCEGVSPLSKDNWSLIYWLRGRVWVIPSLVEAPPKYLRELSFAKGLAPSQKIFGPLFIGSAGECGQYPRSWGRPKILGKNIFREGVNPLSKDNLSLIYWLRRREWVIPSLVGATPK